MDLHWRITRRTLINRHRLMIQTRLLGITSWRQYLDITLVLGVIGALVIILGLWFAFVQWGKAQGWFDPPLVQKLEDPRILINVRNDLTNRPLLSAVYHASEGKVFIAQKGGMIHRYDPKTRLWETETPFRDSTYLQNTDLIFLRSGCGDDFQSQRASHCPDSRSLWGVTSSGGLVRKRGKQWEILIGDTTFIGANGEPVSHNQLTSAAISEDGRWLVLGTREQGLGIYDVQRRSWRSLRPSDFDRLPSLAIRHIRFWKDRFWVGTDAGLAQLRVNAKKIEIKPMADMEGDILELNADKRLWVLRQRACEGTPDEMCLWLGAFTTPGRPPQVFLDERHRYPGLSLDTLVFAQQWPERLAVAGKDGVFIYDMRRHDWQQISQRQVYLTLSLPTGEGFYFAFPGGVGLVRRDAPEEIVEWTLPESRITQLDYINDHPYALTEQGNLYALLESGGVLSVYRKGSTQFDPKTFTAAASVGDKVILVGPEGALLHDVRLRTYDDVERENLPDWFTRPQSRFYTAGANIFVVEDPNDLQVTIHQLDVTNLQTKADLQSAAADAFTQILPGPLRDVSSWQDGSLYALAGDGSAYLLTDSQRIRWTGPSEPQMSVQDFLDVVEMDNGLLISTKEGLRLYDYQRRFWHDFRAPPADAHVLDFARWQGKLFMRTDAHRLVEDAEHSPVLIGDVKGFPFDDETMTDVLLKGDGLYMAAPNVAIRYSLEHRRLVEQWVLQASNSPRFIGILDGVPLTLGDGVLSLGEQVLDPDAGEVLSASLGDGAIWTVRQKDGIRYLKRYDAAAPTSGETDCWFRTPLAKQATNIFDAQKLPNGLVAVATDVGLFLYDPGARTWHATNLTYASTHSRLHRLGDYLVLIYGETDDITIVTTPLQAITTPHSCSTHSVSLSFQEIHARAVAVEPRDAAFAFLEHEGRVRLWQNGSQQTILEPPGYAPRSRFRRVYRVNDFLFFTTNDALWRYDLQQQYWREIALIGAAIDAPVANMDLFQEGKRLTLLVHLQNGEILQGEFNVDALDVDLRSIFSPRNPFNASGQNLLDVQQRSSNLWTFVLTNGIKYFDPIQRAWQPGFNLDQPDVTLRYQMTPNQRGVLVGRNGQTWWVARTTGDGVTDFARFDLWPGYRHALDERGDIWALGPDGRLQHCFPQDASYTCQTANAPTLFLNPSAMRHAYDWEGFHLLETDQGLYLYHAADHQEIPLPAELDTLAPLQQVREGPDKTLWLWDGRTLVILARAGSTVRLRALEEANQVVFDEDGTPWANIGGQWVYWRDDGFRTPRNVPSGAIFVMENARPAAMDASNTLYSWNGEQFIPYAFSLPLPLHGVDVRGLWPVAQDTWWLQIGEHDMVLLAKGLCTPTPAPISSPSVMPTTSITTTTPFTGTQTPTLIPIPTPGPVPCMQIRTQLIAPSPQTLPTPSDIATVKATKGSLILFTRDGRVWRFDAGSQQAVITTQTPPLPPRSLDDQWPGWQDHFGQTPDGRWAYDPITEIQSDSQGSLVAKRPLGDRTLAQAGYFQFSSPSSLDVGWLQWDRPAHEFVILTPKGQVRYPPEAFIRQGEILFEPVEALLARKGGRLVAANRYGLWHYPSSSLRLDDPDIRFQPVDLQPPIQAAHERFMAQNGDILPEGHSIEPRVGVQRIEFGDVILEENIRSGQIQGSYFLTDQLTDAFTNEGFLWDANRKALAFHNGQLFIQDAAGIHPVDSYAHFDAGPTLVDLDMAHIFDEQGVMYLQANATYYRRDGTGWRAIPAHPANSRVLYQDQAWQWALDDGAFQATLHGPSYQFAYRIMPDGLEFTADKLLAATFAQNSLFVMSDAFFEVGDAQALTRRVATRYSPAATDKLETIMVASTPTVFRSLGEDVFQWDTMQNQFVLIPPNKNPYRFRELARTSRLRFLLEQGSVVQEMRLDRLDSESLWTRFAFVNRHFPFDIVTALAADEDRLYVGTAAGLLVYDSPKSWSLDHSAQIIDMRGVSAGLPQAVIRAGRPVSHPDRVVFESQSICYQISRSTHFQLCEASLSAKRTLRGETPWWRWIRENGVLKGVYRDVLTNTYSLSVDLSMGRFPHDRLRQVILCQDRALSLWENDWITLHSSDSIRLDAQIHHFDLSSLEPDRLFCVKRPTWRNGLQISPGAYLLTRSNEVYYLEGQNWHRVENAQEAASLRDVMARPAIYEQGRLRLLQPSPQTPFFFEQRTLDQRWHRLAWQDGRLQIDNWTAFVQVDDQLWAATREGWMPFSLDGVPQAVITPEQLIIVREPETEEGAMCFVTDVMTGDREVVLRCQGDSRLVYQGVLTLSQDRDVFSDRTEDPFQETLLIADFWTWRRTGRTMGDPGSLTVTWRDEPLTFINGRFPFDGVIALATMWPESVEWVARGGGWYQFERKISSLTPKDLQRPQSSDIDPSQVLDFGVTYEDGFDDAHRQMCLKTRDNKTLLITYQYEVQPTSICREYQAHDTLWTYQREGEQLVILPQRVVGGVGARMLQGGRFADDWVVGPPATGWEGEETHYFVPTRAGVLVYDASMRVRAIHVGEFPGLGSAEMPRALLTTAFGKPAYVGTNGFYRLDETRSAFSVSWPWPAQLASPPDAASFGPLDNTMQWTWHDTHGVSYWLLTPSGIGKWTLAVDLFPLSRYQQLLNQRADLPRWIYVTAEKGVLSFYLDGQGEYHKFWDGDPDRLVAAVSIPGAALFIQRDEIYEVHFERMLRSNWIH